MSTSPDNDLDLEKLFLPAWAQEDPAAASKYAKYEGEVERFDRRGDRRGPRPPRREGAPFGRREGNRPGGDRRGGPGPRDGTRPAGGRPDRGGRPERGGGPRGDRRPRPEPPPPLPEINVTLIPEEKGVESLARQIKMTGRAYPLFDIAQMILQKPERYVVRFETKKNAEGKPVQPLFVCALDDTLWLSDDEAVAHVLRKHFNTFYQADRTATEPPKGKYTFVAQCGMSGVILGPPNYHDYQNQLRKLHAERFSRMPFEVYKARVKIVRDEEVVKKWVEDQSWKTEYVCLNMPEATRLPTMEAVEKHFRENHKDNIIKPVEAHTLSGVAARNLRSPELTRTVRSIWEDQRRFPLQIAMVLSQQFASHGLQFFKVNKAITHVCVARPHYLDLSVTPVSEGIKRIVDYINATPKCTRRHLVEALAPSPAPTVLPVTPAENAAVPAAEQPVPGPTAEQTAVIADLHWLIHQGHVIEFANGILETAKKPLPKPVKPAPAPAPVAAEGAATAPAESTATTPAAEATPIPAETGAEPFTRADQPPTADTLTPPAEINAPEFVRPPDESALAEPPPGASLPATPEPTPNSTSPAPSKSSSPAPVESPS